MISPPAAVAWLAWLVMFRPLLKERRTGSQYEFAIIVYRLQISPSTLVDRHSIKTSRKRESSPSSSIDSSCRK